MTIIAGVDCHKETHAIAFLDGVGKVVHDLEIPATAVGYADAIAAARKLGDVVPEFTAAALQKHCLRPR